MRKSSPCIRQRKAKDKFAAVRDRRTRRIEWRTITTEGAMKGGMTTREYSRV